MNLITNTERHALFDAFNAGIRKGTLHLVTPDGTNISFVGNDKGSEASWHIHNWKVVDSLLSRGDIGLGETYASGLWDADNLESLIAIFLDNIEYLNDYANGHKISRIWFYLLNNLLRRNNIRGSRANIRAHYDVGNDFYKIWLDKTMTYSSALYKDGGQTLEQAQEHKYQRILDHIEKSRETILEIGCGWGGFAEQAAKDGHHVTGLTISAAQHEFAKKRLENKKANILLEDYRNIKGKFEAIASIEMFEAVGKKYWPSYFNTIKKCLDNDGVAMIQTITIKDDLFKDYCSRSDYIRHYVFPGGLLPSVQSFKDFASRAGLVCQDVYSFGLDYAKTLRQWLVKFNENEDKIRLLGYDDNFLRSWRIYMSMCAASFACERTNVVQIELRHA